MKRLARLAMLFSLFTASSCSSLSKKAMKPETCEPDYQNVVFHCVGPAGEVTRPFDALIDLDYSLINTKQLGDYMGTCR